MIYELLQTTQNITTSSTTLLEFLGLAIVGLIAYYIAMRFNWLPSGIEKSDRYMTIEQNEEIPRFIEINRELWKIEESNMIKNLGKVWSRRLIITNNNQVNSDFIINNNQVELDTNATEHWTGSAIIFKYNPDDSSDEKSKRIEQLELKIISLTEELKQASLSADLQIQKRIKENALARSAGTSLGYPSTDRTVDISQDDV